MERFNRDVSDRRDFLRIQAELMFRISFQAFNFFNSGVPATLE
jgi:hypothetical protein